MQLLRLRANKDTFRTVEFNPTGLSIIRAIQVTKGKRNTFNSVGKSLMISLIHFCLGSNPKKEFEKLKDWEFYLDVKINNVEYTITRSTGNQNVIKLDEDIFSLNKFKEDLQNKVFFNIPKGTKYITFRTLISRFIRQRKSSYVSYDCFIEKETPYSRLLNNANLLGLDIEKIVTKFELKKELDDIGVKKKNIEKDPIMQDFFDIGKDETIDTDIKYFKDKIERLSKDLKEFKISEHYDYIRRETDELKASLKTNKNKATALENAIRNINKSLDIKPDISSKKIIDFYDKAKIELTNLVVKRLESIETFNKKLLNNRSSRLIEDKYQFEKKLVELNLIIKKVGKKVDEKLKLLDTHGTLDEYTSLTKELSSFEVKLSKLTDYKNLLEKYNEKIEELKIDLGKENIKTNSYLKENTTLKEKNITLFKSFAEEFYQDKKAGIEIQNDTGENQSRFSIKATIDDDTGDGVGNVKLFCFDWTLLELQYNHNIKFLFHDSRILEPLDPRQIATLFRVANEHAKDKYQYIICANEKEIDAIHKEIYFNSDEFEKIIEKNIVLDLTDNRNHEGKLLGIQINLNYN